MQTKGFIIKFGSIAAVLVVVLVLWVWYVECAGNNCNFLEPHQATKVNSFQECVQQSGQVMESYPRQCKYGDQTFIEEITPIEYKDKIRITSPSSNQLVKSPLTLRGEARGNWYFEATFPLKVVDANNKELAIVPGYAQAQGEWMTTDYVSFEATITFSTPTTQTGYIIFQKDNPSGLPEFDDELRVPVRFEGVK